MMPESMLPLRAISESKVLLQPGSVLMSVAHVTTKGHMVVWAPGSCLKPS